jgi:hypothetical protein
LNLNFTLPILVRLGQDFVGATNAIGRIAMLRRNEAAFNSTKVCDGYDNRYKE